MVVVHTSYMHIGTMYFAVLLLMKFCYWCLQVPSLQSVL